MLKISSKTKGFEQTFSELKFEDKFKLINPSKLKFYYLDSRNNKFDHSNLLNYIRKNIGRYVFSRVSIKEFIENDDEEAIGIHAIEKIRSVKNKDDLGAGGELGEILLYLFLEQELGAPKILSKVELKTTANQYVYGCDGIHFLEIEDELKKEKYYQLIFGEAKIKKNLKDSIKDAFDSINSSLKEEFEMRLIHANIMNETFDYETMKKIKNILIPTEEKKEEFENAYGIFLGFSLEIDKNNIPTRKYKEKLELNLKENISKIIPYILNKIESNKKLKHSSFYIYILPFDDAQNDRIDILRKLKLED